MTIEVVEFLQGLQNGFMDFFFNFVSFIGEKYFYIAVISYIYWIYDKRLGEIMGMSLAFSAVTNNIIKEAVGAERPYQKYPDRATNFRPGSSTGHSFPSGHVQNFTSIVFGAYYKIKKRWMFYTALTLSILMMLSRMYLGVHFLEDVVVSLILGITIGFAVNKLYVKFDKDIDKLYKIFVIILVVLSPLLFILKDNDFFTGMGLFYGFILAMIFERKYVNFSHDIPLIKKVTRYVIGVILLLVLQIGLGKIFSMIYGESISLENIFDFIRYFLVAFVAFGVYPYIFKKYNF